MRTCSTSSTATLTSHSHQPLTSHSPATLTSHDDCNKWHSVAASHTIPDPGEGEQWCCKDSGGLYTCEQDEEKEEEEVVVEQKGGKKRQREQTPDLEHLSDQLQGENEALKRCKQEFIEEDHAALHQQISAVEAVAQCSICSDTMKQASTVSGCGHTFCRSCIEEAVRVKGCCPVCRQPVWHRDITHARLLSGVMAELDGLRSEAPL